MTNSTHKVVLITGAARRIGAAIARYLHKNQMNVMVHYRSSEKEAAQLVKELNKHRSDSAMAMKADLNNIQEVYALIANAHQHFGRIDCLVNNASEFYPTPIGDITELQWDELMNSNLKAPLFLSQAAAPYIAQQLGSIINIIDIHSEHPLKNHSVYCVSKAGLVMLTKSLAKELAPSVRVNGISPGAIAWPEGKNTVDDHLKQKIIDKTLLKRSGSPEDIAKAAYFLINDADYITGQIINIDGGRSTN